MTIQFIVEANQRNLQTEQVLPTLFTETLYTGCNKLYLIHNRGTKHAVFIRNVTRKNNYVLYGDEWRGFLSDIKYVRLSNFHFIRQGVNEYYVTAYQNSGYEYNGYDLTLAGYRQKRCLVTMGDIDESPVLPYQFLVNLEHEQVGIMVSGVLVSTVTWHRVVLPDDRRRHVFRGQGWSILAHVVNLEVGTKLLFTNLLNNSVSLVPFDDSGIAMRVEKVLRMKLNEQRSFVKFREKDDRLEQYCDWDDHEEHHDDEDKCFYSPIVAYVTDLDRLTIPANFVSKYNMKMHHNALLRYETTLFYVDVDFEPHEKRADDNNNHMNIKTNWRIIVDECDFYPNKMVRFKLIYDGVPDVLWMMKRKELHPLRIPLFHMC